MSAGDDPFTGVVGHARALAFLRAVLRSGRVPTGFLFHGAAGRGKRRVARAFLGALFDGASSLENDPDVELVTVEEGKQRISIDRLRELRQWFSRAPFRGDRRAALIDDAHLMTPEAQNSLLKLLEEPPRHGLLVLVTPEPGALLETVHSRLQSLYFGPVSGPDAVKLVAAGSSLPPAEIEAALDLAQGSPGEAMALLGDAATQEALAMAPVLLAPRPGPFAFAEELFSASGMRTLAVARERCRLLIETAITFTERRLVALHGLGGREETLVAPDLEAFAPEDLEEVLEELFLAQRRIAANVAPRLAIEALKIALARRHAVVRARHALAP